MAIPRGVTLDAGPLIAAQRNDRRFWVWWKWYTSLRLVATIPAPVIAQVWRGPSTSRIGQIIGACRVVPMDADSARRTGALCASARAADVVDAFVVQGAAMRGDDVLTTDPDGLGALAAHVVGLGRIMTLLDLG